MRFKKIKNLLKQKIYFRMFLLSLIFYLLLSTYLIYYFFNGFYSFFNYSIKYYPYLNILFTLTLSLPGIFAGFSLAILPFKGLEIQLLGIIVLLISIYILTKENVCKIN